MSFPTFNGCVYLVINGRHTGSPNVEKIESEEEATRIVLEYLFDHMGDYPEDTLLWQSVRLLWPEDFADWLSWYSR